MVLAFIISDLNCQILFNSTFDFNQSDFKHVDLMNIVQEVKSEFDSNSLVYRSGNFEDAKNVLDFETKGIISMKFNNNWNPVIYRTFCGCMYILLCDITDNRLLAYRTLSVIIQILKDTIPKVTSLTSQFIFRADAVSMIVNSLIPSGHLLFLNDHAVQEMSKDLYKKLVH